MNAIWAPPPPDAQAVADAAEALRISEFDFFRLAFRRWSGREPDSATLEKAFVAYMFEQRAPHWARHLCREVLKRRRDGTLDPDAFDVDGLPRRQPLPRLGRFSWSMMTAMILLILLMSLDTTYVRHRNFPMGCPGYSGSMFLDRHVGILFRDRGTECPPFTYPDRNGEFGLK